MDKLQPVLKHHFWICLGLAVIFVIVGWWAASGAIAESIAEGEKNVTDAFSKARAPSGAANATINAKAAELNQSDRAALSTSSRGLYNRQIQSRVWHSDVQSHFESIPFGAMIDENVKDRRLQEGVVRKMWGRSYRARFTEILNEVKPFDRKDGTGLVLVSPNNVDHGPFDRWERKRPVSTEIWNAQEDLWLVHSILKSIRHVNEVKGAKRITDASVRQIVSLRLRGGERDTKPGAAAAGSTGGFSGEETGSAIGFGDFNGGGGVGSGGSSPMAWAGFAGSQVGDILTEEFGAVAMAQGGFAGGGGFEAFGAAMSPEMGQGTASSESTDEESTDRYVDKAEGLPYKTRAFTLHVKVLSQDIPTLLTSLTNSDFPVEIVRVDLSFMGTSQQSESLTGGYGPMTGSEAGYGADGGYSDPEAGFIEGDAGSGYGSQGYGDGYGSGGYGDPAGAYGDSESGYSGGDLYSDGGYGGASTSAVQTPEQKAAKAIAAAMASPTLVDLRIGGLLTLYQTPEEEKAEQEAVSAESQEAAADAAAPVDEEVMEGDPTVPTDGTSPETDPAADGSTPGVTETPAATDVPASTPDTDVTPVPEGTDPAGTAAPASTTTPTSPENPSPAETTPASTPTGT